MIERITTEHLVLRKAREDDLTAIWNNIWRDEKIAEMMLFEPTRTLEEAKVRMERTIEYQKSGYAYFVCLKETDEPIGFAGIKKCAEGGFEETGICVAHAHQRKGYGEEVLRALVELAFDKLGGSSFTYGCFRENIYSARLCKKCGFVYSHSENKVRRWDGLRYLCDFYTLVK